MYIQITTRCNMECEHCCYSCTAQGEDMSIETFKNALKFDSECVSIGGGEPTVHPKFWEFIGYALGNCEYVWLATNGKIRETALSLAKLNKKEVLTCELSQDEYHEPIDLDVVKAFEKSIRDITHGGTTFPMFEGRAKDIIDKEYATPGCVCESIFVCPNGDVKPCGCADSPIVGNVNNPNFDLYEAMKNLYGEDYEYDTCYHNQPVAV